MSLWSLIIVEVVMFIDKAIDKMHEEGEDRYEDGEIDVKIMV